MNSLHATASKLKKVLTGQTTRAVLENYYKRFEEYSFVDGECVTEPQFEASITRLYHTVEKGLSYENYRAGFGKDNVEMLMKSLEQYAGRKLDIDKEFYQTALSCLHEYIRKNKDHGVDNPELETRIKNLPGKPNDCGGAITVSAPVHPERLSYKELVTERHSIRHFSDTPLDIEIVQDAIQLAQFTPSACNRQGWKTRIVADKNRIKRILENQNGNRGFGHEFDKLLIITADLQTEQKNREIFEVFIDGGMYAESVINSLYYYGIGAVPLSAALTAVQEKNVRGYADISDAEVLIMFIGIGNYPEGEFLTTRSERRSADIEVI